ncbi:MAG TPA: DUF1048 domain-containing protein [Candidatus Saccharimonadales bacterium]|nr:DUF1048 domain-containing protein [Candidatus Saccharimonadales bacterium]
MNLINKVIGDLEAKKEWKALQARAKALPEEYQVVYDEVKNYVWHGGLGVVDPTNMFTRLVDVLEEGAAQGKHVLDVTGRDIAAFVDTLVHDDEKLVDDARQKLNHAISKKLQK